MRIPFGLWWLIPLWIFLLGDEVLERFFSIPPDDAFLFSTLLGLFTFLALGLLHANYVDRPIPREEAPQEPRRRGRYEPPPIPRELQDRPLVLQDLKLIIRSDDPGKPNGRIGTVVRPDDISVRPYAVIRVNEGASCIGKKATLQFSIRGPRKRKPNQQFKVPVTFQEGHNEFWPQTLEFPIKGHHREQGDWRLALDIVTADGGVRTWYETDFRIIEEVNLEQLVGDDAMLTVPRGVAAAEVAERIERPRIDDLLG